MLIKSLVSAVTPTESFVPGVNYNVPKALGTALVKAGHAIEVKPESDTGTKSDPVPDQKVVADAQQ